jgi:type IV pilus assembly protein PilM
MAQNTATLYISDVNMRLMVTHGKRIIKLADMPLDTSLTDIDTPEKEAAMAEKVKYLFKSNHISSRKIILGISGLHCLTRPIALPDLPKAMLDEAVTREAKRVLPVPVDQLYISWQNTSVAGGKLQAFMVAMPRHIADRAINIVTQAGFKPYLMDIKPLALARLAKKATAIIVDVQPSEFDIVIMVNGIPQPIRTVPFPRETPSLKDRMVIVKDDLERTVQFFNANNAETKIQPGETLLVSGELADEEELCQELGKNTGYKIELLESPLKCLKHLDPSHHLVNVGLALKELPRETGRLVPNFNTLPVPYQPKQISTTRLVAIPTAAAAVLLIVLLGVTVRDGVGSLESTKSSLASTTMLADKKQAQKKELSGNIAAMQVKLAGIQESQKSYVAALDVLTRTGTKMNDDLRTTVNNAVPALDFTSLSLSPVREDVSGKASSEQEVMQYVRKLTDSGRFAEITIADISLETASGNTTTQVKFTLNCRLKE